jgi:hypothetical protein
MGQAVEDMLEGFTCEQCGEIFDDCINGDDSPGYPRSCDGCKVSAALPQRLSKKPPTPPQPMTSERVNRKIAKARAKKARNRANRAARDAAGGAP